MSIEVNETAIEKALKVWPVSSQIGQCQEECAELITALSRYLHRSRGSEDEVIDEIADVFVTVAQMAKLFGESKVQRAIYKKIGRLAERLREYQDNNSMCGPEDPTAAVSFDVFLRPTPSNCMKYGSR